MIDPGRRRIMKAVRGRDTRPEMAVRRFLHRSGFRYRLHDRSLPGSPDIVLKRHRTVVFVHGCFWHRHPGCPKATIPKTREAFWRAKFAANVTRDLAAMEALTGLGWQVLTVWECNTNTNKALVEALDYLLRASRRRC